jgi:hypothetical protein
MLLDSLSVFVVPPTETASSRTHLPSQELHAVPCKAFLSTDTQTETLYISTPILAHRS